MENNTKNNKCENCGRLASEIFEDNGMTYSLCYFCFRYVPMGELKNTDENK